MGIGPPIGAEGAGGSKIHGSQWDGLRQGRQAGAVPGSGSRRGGRLQGCSGCWSTLPSRYRTARLLSLRWSSTSKQSSYYSKSTRLHRYTTGLMYCGITDTAASSLWWRPWPCQTDIETPPVVACKPCLLTSYFALPTAATLDPAPTNAPTRAVRFPDTWAKPTAEP